MGSSVIYSPMSPPSTVVYIECYLFLRVLVLNDLHDLADLEAELIHVLSLVLVGSLHLDRFINRY